MNLLLNISIFVFLIFFNTPSYSKLIEFEKYNNEANIQNNDQYIDFIRDAVINQPEYKEIIAKKTKFNFIESTIKIAPRSFCRIYFKFNNGIYYVG